MHQQLISHQYRAFEKNNLRASFKSLSEPFKLKLMKAILTLKSEQICNFKANRRNGGAIIVALLLSSCVLLAFPLSCFNTWESVFWHPYNLFFLLTFTYSKANSISLCHTLKWTIWWVLKYITILNVLVFTNIQYLHFVWECFGALTWLLQNM